MGLISALTTLRKNIALVGPIGVDTNDITRPIEDLGGGLSLMHIREIDPQNREYQTLEQVAYTVNETLAIIADKDDDLVLLTVNTVDGRPLAATEQKVFNRKKFAGIVLSQGGGARFFNKEEGSGRLIEYFVDETVATILAGEDLFGWVRLTLTHLDFQAAALTNDISIYSLPAGHKLHAVAMNPDTAFLGAGITDYSISVGIAATPDRYSDAFDVTVLNGIGDFQYPVIESWTAATDVRAFATSIGADLDQSTAGVIEIYLLVSKIKS